MSNLPGKDFVLTDYAKNLIEFKAWQLSLRQEFCRSDREDLQQELWLAVLKQADRYDPTRSSTNTFVDRVVRTAVAIVLRNRRRRKRSTGSPVISLDVASSKRPLSVRLSEADLSRRTGSERRDETADRERSDALHAALEKMPPEISDVCRRVMGGSIIRAAKDLGTSRRQIRNALATARSYLEQSGIETA